MTNQAKMNSLNYLIDSTFNKVNRLFVWSSENEDDGKTSFSKYYTPKVEIKDFNVLVHGKAFFEIRFIRSIIEMNKNNDYTTDNLLGCEYFSKDYKLIRRKKKQLLNFPEVLWVSYKMETKKIINLLNDSSNEKPKLATENGTL